MHAWRARFAAAWGNDQFRKPEPRERVLYGVNTHDDGWAERDAHPSITRQGKPSAFSRELVGKYSAFEEIDLSEYLAVRDRAVRIIAEKDAYAGLLISMHTYNLLTAHVDRSAIAPNGLVMLDDFLQKQKAYRAELIQAVESDATLTAEDKSEQTILEHFRLLQACDNLSLLACVSYGEPAHLLHPLPLNDGSSVEVRVRPRGVRYFELYPWPLKDDECTFSFPARHVQGKIFESSNELSKALASAAEESISLTLSRGK